MKPNEICHTNSVTRTHIFVFELQLNTQMCSSCRDDGQGLNFSIKETVIVLFTKEDWSGKEGTTLYELS